MEVSQAQPRISIAFSASTLRYLIVGGGALVMIGLLFAVPAFACGPGNQATASPSRAAAGQTINVFGQNWTPDAAVAVHWDGAGGPLLANAQTGADGAFAASVTIPADATAGTHAMFVQEQGTEAQLNAAFNVTVEAEEPVAEEPPAEEPPAEEPPAEEPVAEEPPAEEPVAEEPPAEEPAAEEPVAEEPVAEEPVAEEPVAEEPAAEEPVAEEPAAEEPVAEDPPRQSIGETPRQSIGEAPRQSIGEAPRQSIATNEQAPAASSPSGGPAQPTQSGAAPAAPEPSGPGPAQQDQAPDSQPAPERELVGVDAAEAYVLGPAERSQFAGAGITAPEASTAPADASTEGESSSGDEQPGTTPADTGRFTPWALVPLLLLAGGLFAASAAAVAMELRERERAKAKVKA